MGRSDARSRHVVAGVLLVAAAVALVVAFTSGDSGATQQASPVAGVTTPLWSVRRVPEPVVEAVGAQHLQAALDAAAPGDGTCFVVSAGNHVLATHGADTPLIGASTQKLLVAAAALSMLGPDSTFQTARGRVRPARRRHRRPGVAGRRRRPGARRPATTRRSCSRSPRRRATSPPASRRWPTRWWPRACKSIPGGVVGDDSRYDEQRYLPIVEGQLPHRRRDRPDERAHRERRVRLVVTGAQGSRRRSRRATPPPSSPTC